MRKIEKISEDAPPPKKLKVIADPIPAKQNLEVIEIDDGPTCEKYSETEIHQSPKHAFDLLTWNLDGLDDRFLKLRIDYVSTLIQSIKPDVIFLQEIIALTHSRLENLLSSHYEFKTPSWKFNEIAPYYCLILVSKSACSTLSGSTNTHWFENSVMYRHLLSTTLVLKKFPQEKLTFMTSHLESTWQFSNQRITQLKNSINRLSKFDKNDIKTNVVAKIFGGDLNLVDSEVKKAGLPLGIIDCWEHLGSPQEIKYTWDLKLNDNIKSSAKNKARRRFDRIFVSPNDFKEAEGSDGSKVYSFKPYHMKLIGTSRIQACEMFPSDHFGILTKFEYETETN